MNTCLYANDIDDYACKVYRKNWNDGTMHQEDIRNVTAGYVCRRGIPQVITAGFPCVDLSLMGAGCRERKGLDGDASGLVYTLANLLKEIKSDWILLENVNEIQAYKAELMQLFSDWRLQFVELRADEFGVPTRRTRTLIIGHTRRRSRPPVFDTTYEPRTIWRDSGHKDSLPMCLPWKGGLNYERFGSCLLENTKVDPTRIRESNGTSRQLDARRYLALGNAMPPKWAEMIARYIMSIDGEFNFAEFFAGTGCWRLGFEWASGREKAISREEAGVDG
jgi:DNA (cytosine-5)-methyltransferase 1